MEDRLLETTSKKGLINLCKSRRNQIEILKNQTSELIAALEKIMLATDKVGVSSFPVELYNEVKSLLSKYKAQ